MTLNEELIQLRGLVKELEKENRRLKKENDFLEEASAFFAASRLKSAKTKDGELKGNIAFYCRFALFLTTSIPA